MFHRALLNLMETKPINKITIKELCEAASLNRGTFYLHYTEPQDILTEIEDDFIEENMSFLTRYLSPEHDTDPMSLMYSHMLKNQDTYRLIIGKGNDTVFQERLKKLGYYSGSVDGDYGNGTKTAVKAFQKRNGLTANGKVNSKTLAKLNSSGAKKANASDSGSGGTGTERLNWFNGGSSKIPKGATFKVKDIKTGKVFTVKRWSGGNHIDAEPASSDDTAIMKKIYGHWSWKRRAVLVKYNGHVYAGSMNGMPHGTQTIKGNNFDGHFCIHFYGSKTHGSKKVDDMHQKMVAEAMKHSW